MLKFLTIMLCCTAQEIMLKNLSIMIEIMLKIIPKLMIICSDTMYDVSMHFVVNIAE